MALQLSRMRRSRRWPVSTTMGAKSAAAAGVVAASVRSSATLTAATSTGGGTLRTGGAIGGEEGEGFPLFVPYYLYSGEPVKEGFAQRYLQDWDHTTGTHHRHHLGGTSTSSLADPHRSSPASPQPQTHQQPLKDDEGKGEPTPTPTPPLTEGDGNKTQNGSTESVDPHHRHHADRARYFVSEAQLRLLAGEYANATHTGTDTVSSPSFLSQLGSPAKAYLPYPVSNGLLHNADALDQDDLGRFLRLHPLPACVKDQLRHRELDNEHPALNHDEAALDDDTPPAVGQSSPFQFVNFGVRWEPLGSTDPRHSLLEYARRREISRLEATVLMSDRRGHHRQHSDQSVDDVVDSTTAADGDGALPPTTPPLPTNTVVSPTAGHHHDAADDLLLPLTLLPSSLPIGNFLLHRSEYLSALKKEEQGGRQQHQPEPPLEHHHHHHSSRRVHGGEDSFQIGEATALSNAVQQLLLIGGGPQAHSVSRGGGGTTGTEALPSVFQECLWGYPTPSCVQMSLRGYKGHHGLRSPLWLTDNVVRHFGIKPKKTSGTDTGMTGGSPPLRMPRAPPIFRLTDLDLSRYTELATVVEFFFEPPTATTESSTGTTTQEATTGTPRQKAVVHGRPMLHAAVDEEAHGIYWQPLLSTEGYLRSLLEEEAVQTLGTLSAASSSTSV